MSIETVRLIRDGRMEVEEVNMVLYVHRKRKAYQGRVNGGGGSKHGALRPPKP